MQYQLSDLNNGPFGEIYDTLQEAEDALAEAITEGQAYNEAHGHEYLACGLSIPQAKDFLQIVEVL